jgi:UTP--glucose-1-phosphate uridylyltransferase
MKIRKAVITAAGWGTRFLPLSKSVPKELLPLLDKPIIQYAVEEAVACGIELVIIVTSQGKMAIESYFTRNAGLEHVLEQQGKTILLEKLRTLSEMVDFCFVPQVQVLGLGHAVLATRAVVGNEPFAVILPDDLFDKKEKVLQKMINIYNEYQGSVIALKPVKQSDIERYGIVEVDKKDDFLYRIKNLMEKPQPSVAPSNLAVMGRYILMPEIFSALEATSPGWGGEIQLTDGLKCLLQKQAIYGYQIQGNYYDTGTISGWIQTTMTFALEHPEYGPALKNILTSFSGDLHQG